MLNYRRQVTIAAALRRSLTAVMMRSTLPALFPSEAKLPSAIPTTRQYPFIKLCAACWRQRRYYNNMLDMNSSTLSNGASSSSHHNLPILSFDDSNNNGVDRDQEILHRHRKLFDSAAGQLNVKQPEDWYNISREEFAKRIPGGINALRHYNDSLIRALTTVYSDYEWLPWRFKMAPRGFWADEANQRKFLDWAAKQLNFATPEDWYRVSRDDIARLGGNGLLQTCYNNGSLSKLLSRAYPEVEWLPWRFNVTPAGYWSDIANQRKFFEWAAKQLNVSRYEDWYRVPREDVIKLGGASLLNLHYDGSFIKALAAVYSEYEWLPWRFRSVPANFWSDLANQRKFFDWAAKQLGVDKYEDWYTVPRERILEMGAGGLLHEHYNNSFISALAAVYPEYEWQPWRFPVVPSRWWMSESNQRKYVEWAATQLGVKQLEDWYSVSREKFASLSGSGLLEKYDNSLAKALAAVYPDFEWQPWRFQTVPAGYWNNKENHRLFFDWAATQLDVNKLEDWYSVSREDLYRVGAGGLLHARYDGSVAKALMAVYPNHPWRPWLFENFRLKRNDVGVLAASTDDSSESMLRQYIEFLARELRIEQLDEWYRVAAEQIRHLGGYSIIMQHGGLYSILKKLYPHHSWDKDRFNAARGKRSSQRWLRVAAQRLFAGKEIFEEYQHPQLTFGDTINAMTFDVWIPSISLAFEYHGSQHYHDLPLFGIPSTTQGRDAEKIQACAQAGITLVVVPYWWNRSIEDLAATIATARPDLLVQEEQQQSSNLLAEAAAKGTPIPISYEEYNNNNNKNNKNSNKNQMKKNKMKQTNNIEGMPPPKAAPPTYKRKRKGKTT